jgi:hypothetical protein
MSVRSKLPVCCAVVAGQPDAQLQQALKEFDRAMRQATKPVPHRQDFKVPASRAAGKTGLDLGNAVTDPMIDPLSDVEDTRKLRKRLDHQPRRGRRAASAGPPTMVTAGHAAIGQPSSAMSSPTSRALHPTDSRFTDRACGTAEEAAVLATQDRASSDTTRAARSGRLV